MVAEEWIQTGKNNVICIVAAQNRTRDTNLIFFINLIQFLTASIIFNIYNIVFTLEARCDINCVKSAVKLQPTYCFTVLLTVC